VVPEIHEDVTQSTAPTLAVGEASAAPKLMPETVAVAPPDVGRFAAR
jgi:hypothetical protein